MIALGSHLKYGKALHSVAAKAGAAEAVLKDLEGLSHLFKDKSFHDLVKKVSFMEKNSLEKVLVSIFQGKIHQLSLNLLLLLARARKLGLVMKIGGVYRQIYHESKNINEITVRSARRLNSEEELQLIEKLRQKIDRPVSVRFEQHPSLIGGIQIYDKGYLTDFSLRNYLDTLKKHLLSIKN